MKKMRKLRWTGALALLAGMAFADYGVATAEPPHGPVSQSLAKQAQAGQDQSGMIWRVASRNFDFDDVEDRVEDQGYDDVVIITQRPPYTAAYGCLGENDYRLTLDDKGDVVDSQHVGRCGSKESVSVRAPYTDVDTKDGDVRVRAPYADVDVDKKGVRVRAPYVDLNIPR